MIRDTSDGPNGGCPGIYTLSAVVLTIHGGIRVCHDFAIFRASYGNLVSGRTPYALHREAGKRHLQVQPHRCCAFRSTGSAARKDMYLLRYQGRRTFRSRDAARRGPITSLATSASANVGCIPLGMAM